MNSYQKFLKKTTVPGEKISSGKNLKIPFDKWPEESKSIDSTKAHVSMDGVNQKVNVKFLN